MMLIRLEILVKEASKYTKIYTLAVVEVVHEFFAYPKDTFLDYTDVTLLHI